MRMLLFEDNSVLKLLLSAFNHTQNALWRGMKEEISNKFLQR